MEVPLEQPALGQIPAASLESFWWDKLHQMVAVVAWYNPLTSLNGGMMLLFLLGLYLGTKASAIKAFLFQAVVYTFGLWSPCARQGCPCLASWNGKAGEFCCRTCTRGHPCNYNLHSVPFVWQPTVGVALVAGIATKMLDVLAFWITRCVILFHHMVRVAPVGILAVLLLRMIPSTEGTCIHCFDQLKDAGCDGSGNKCPLITTTASNAAITVAALGGAAISAGAATSYGLQSLVPREYLVVLTRTVLDTLLAVRKRNLPGATPDVRGLSLEKILQAFKENTVPRAELVAELTTLIPGATGDQAEQLKLALETMKLYSQISSSDGASAQRPVSYVGFWLYLWAIAGKIVARNTSSASVSTEKDSTDSASAAKLTEKISWSTSMADFANRISVWQTVAHALGACNILTANKFFHTLVYDLILRDKQPWQLAFALVMVYLEDLDFSSSLNVGSIIESGGYDSRLARAKTRAIQHYGLSIFRSGQTPDHEPKTGAKSWNGKCTPNATSCCHAFNFGTEHAQKHLKSDGTCIFKHECAQWVTGKGPDGICGSTAHGRKQCDNPNKTNDKDRK